MLNCAGSCTFQVAFQSRCCSFGPCCAESCTFSDWVTAVLFQCQFMSIEISNLQCVWVSIFTLCAPIESAGSESDDQCGLKRNRTPLVCQP